MARRHPSERHQTGKPSTLTLDQLVDLVGRVPVGISPSQNPGPFDASWTLTTTHRLWTIGPGLLDASRKDSAVLVLRGGGLHGPRVLSLDDTSWQVEADTVAARVAQAAAAQTTMAERALWRRWLPAALLLAAMVQAALAARDRARSSASTSPRADTTAVTTDPARSPLDAPS